MAAPKIKLNHAAVRAILRSDAMGNRLSQAAKKAAPARPDISVSAPFKGRNRARVQIVATSKPAVDELRKKFRR